jgi:hypothetical protein
MHDALRSTVGPAAGPTVRDTNAGKPVFAEHQPYDGAKLHRVTAPMRETDQATGGSSRLTENAPTGHPKHVAASTTLRTLGAWQAVRPLKWKILQDPVQRWCGESGEDFAPPPRLNDFHDFAAGSGCPRCIFVGREHRNHKRLLFRQPVFHFFQGALLWSAAWRERHNGQVSVQKCAAFEAKNVPSVGNFRRYWNAWTTPSARVAKVEGDGNAAWITGFQEVIEPPQNVTGDAARVVGRWCSSTSTLALNQTLASCLLSAAFS